MAFEVGTGKPLHFNLNEKKKTQQRRFKRGEKYFYKEMSHVCEFKFSRKWENDIGNLICVLFYSIINVYTAGDTFLYHINLIKTRVFLSSGFEI